MFPRGKNQFASQASLETRCDAMLLGKLGHELAHIYHDTLHSPLPSRLKSLIERLETALDGSEHPGAQAAASSRERVRR